MEPHTWVGWAWRQTDWGLERHLKPLPSHLTSCLQHLLHPLAAEWFPLLFISHGRTPLPTEIVCWLILKLQEKNSLAQIDSRAHDGSVNGDPRLGYSNVKVHFAKTFTMPLGKEWKRLAIHWWKKWRESFSGKSKQ